MEMLTIPASQSSLVNTLLRVITDPDMPVEVASRAAELIAFDLRVDQWFVDVGKLTATNEEMRLAIKKTGNLTREVESAWTEYSESQQKASDTLLGCIGNAIDEFGQILKSKGKSAPG